MVWPNGMTQWGWPNGWPNGTTIMIITSNILTITYANGRWLDSSDLQWPMVSNHPLIWHQGEKKTTQASREFTDTQTHQQLDTRAAYYFQKQKASFPLLSCVIVAKMFLVMAAKKQTRSRLWHTVSHLGKGSPFAAHVVILGQIIRPSAISISGPNHYWFSY